jgi:hypothetical protein
VARTKTISILNSLLAEIAGNASGAAEAIALDV